MSDPLTFGRSEALRDCVRKFLKSHPVEKPWELEIAAMLAQIGMVTIPPEVIRKIRACQRLTGPEQDMLARVPEISAGLLENIPRLEDVAKIVLYQNKHHDGSGFPVDSVAGDAIPMGARLLRVLGDFATLQSAGQPAAKAIAELESRPGIYDPNLLGAAAVCFGATVTVPQAVHRAVMEVTVANLRVGHVLAANIETHNGVMLVAAETAITSMMMEKLRNFAALNGIKQPLHVISPSPRAS
jgi:hypothetical protein